MREQLKPNIPGEKPPLIPTLTLHDEVETVKGKVIYLFTPENSNLESSINEINELISHTWGELIESCESGGNISFESPNICFFDGEIELEERSTANIFYHTPSNSIYVNRYNFIYLLPYTGNSIGLVVMIAHEIGHALQNANSCRLKKFQREQNADFLSGFMIKTLYENGTINEEDTIEAKNIMAEFGKLCDNNFIQTMKANIHGNDIDRLGAFEKGLKASTEHALLTFS